MSVNRPVLIAAAVAVAGFLLVWLLGGTLTEPDPSDFCGLAIPEGAAYRMEPRWWPPGTGECVVETGGVVSTRLHVPWEEWLVIALVAAACGFAATTRKGRILAALLLLLGLAVFFL